MTAPYANYIVEYYDGIINGRYVVGKWIRLIYEYVVAGLQRGDFFFNAKKANKAIRFIENFCHHCEGRTDLLKLEVWQKAAVSLMFGIVESDGTRVFREVFVVIGRKNGKTLFASAVIAYMAYLPDDKERAGIMRTCEKAPFRYLHRRHEHGYKTACVQCEKVGRL